MMNVNPTRMELTRLKKRLATAERGHKLLKDKRDEMVRRFLGYIRENQKLRKEVDKKLGKAFSDFNIAQAIMGEDQIDEALLCPAREANIHIDKQTIMNIDVPKFTFTVTEEKNELPYGFAFTTGELDQAVLDVASLLPDLIKLAEIEKTCNILADEIEKTRRRVNALEHIMIPEMQETIKYISMKLEDNERSNIIRLMKVKDIVKEDV